MEAHQGIISGGTRQICCSMYKTQAKVCGGQLNAVDNDTSPYLWHKRLAHMREKELQLLAKQSLIPMAKDKSSNRCDYCLFGKQHRVSFQKNSTQKLEKLELVYSDVCGPMEVDSLGSNKYLVLSLTTLHERHRYTCCIQKVRYSSNFKNSMPWWRERQEILLSDFKPIMVENTSPRSSKNIAPSMESCTRRRFLVHRGIMVL